MIKSITTSELPYISGSDGLVLQGCGGPAEQWLEGINGMLTEEGILQNGAVFKDAHVFQHEGLTNILYSFDDIEPCNLNMGKFAMWRLQSHSSFGGTWLSDYLPNRLGMELDEQATAEGKPSVRTVPYQIERPIELADCLPGGMETDLKGKVVAVSAEILRPEFQKMPFQVMLATGGFGCSPEASGRAVFGTSLYTDEQERWNRSDIVGVLDETRLPAWAQDKLITLRAPAEKESVIAKIREAKAAAKKEPPAERKPKTHDKSGPEL